MRILHISDTHSRHRLLHDLPASDVIVHAGDISWGGKPEEVLDFIEWFSGLKYRYKVFIAGNHDFCLDGKNPARIKRFLPKNCFYLYQSGITIEGLNFWGIPLFISDELKGNFAETAGKIPPDTDILITHRPPYGILDRANNTSYGCMDLLQTVLKISPRYHLFGHIHDARGVDKIYATTFSNAALLNEAYQLTNEPFLFDV
jgi:Icc-related predicted phosphoesterase